LKRPHHGAWTDAAAGSCFRNLNKVGEIKTLLEGLPFEVISLRELPVLPPVEEDQPTLAGNALKKAAAAVAVAGKEAVIMADDSGLEVEALDGRPGLHAARFAGPDADDAANNRLASGKAAGAPARKARGSVQVHHCHSFPGR